METKQRMAIYLEPSMILEIESAMKKANATSKGDFIRQAVSFYLGYLYQDKTVNYLSPLLVSAMKSEIRSSTKFICETLFKLAVEQAIQNNIIAFANEITEEELDRLRITCEQTVAESNGILTSEDAYRWQQG